MRNDALTIIITMSGFVGWVVLLAWWFTRPKTKERSDDRG